MVWLKGPPLLLIKIKVFFMLIFMIRAQEEILKSIKGLFKQKSILNNSIKVVQVIGKNREIQQYKMITNHKLPQIIFIKYLNNYNILYVCIDCKTVKKILQ